MDGTASRASKKSLRKAGKKRVEIVDGTFSITEALLHFRGMAGKRVD
jgi:hypothetical protein